MPDECIPQDKHVEDRQESTHHVVNGGIGERIANEDSFERQDLTLLCGPTVALCETMRHLDL